MPVRSVDEQLALILSGAVRPAPVRVAIAEAHGLRSAEEVVASRPLPGFDQAAIDGYAVRSVDLAGAGEETPVVLPVVGEIPAGSRQPLRLQPGQAVRVAAGAPLPTLADAVVPVGHTDARHGQADGDARGAVGGVRAAGRRGRAARGRRRPPGRGARRGPGRHARRGRAGQGAGAPPAAGVGDRGRRRAGRRRPHPRRGAGAGRLLARAQPRPPARPAPRRGRAGLVRGDARELAAAVQDRLPFTRRPRRVRGRRRDGRGSRCRPRWPSSASSTPPGSPCTPARRRRSAGWVRTAFRPSCSRRTRRPRCCCSRCWCGR